MANRLSMFVLNKLFIQLTDNGHGLFILVMFLSLIKSFGITKLCMVLQQSQALEIDDCL